MTDFSQMRYSYVRQSDLELFIMDGIVYSSVLINIILTGNKIRKLGRAFFTYAWNTGRVKLSMKHKERMATNFHSTTLQSTLPTTPSSLFPSTTNTPSTP